jgi:hypothetical protein
MIWVTIMNDQTFQIIVKEIEVIDGRIKQMEDIRRIVKSWCIITWGAAMGLLIREQQEHIALAALIPLAFWWTEMLYWRRENTFFRRLKQIRKFLNGSFGFGGKEVPSDFNLLEISFGYESRRDGIWESINSWSIASLYLLLGVITFIAWWVA